MSLEDTFTLTIESPDFPCDDLSVRSFKGKEAISRLFRYDIEIVCRRHDGPEADAMTGAHVTLVLERFAGSARAGTACGASTASSPRSTISSPATRTSASTASASSPRLLAVAGGDARHLHGGQRP